jgi:hypothetical protein
MIYSQKLLPMVFFPIGLGIKNATGKLEEVIVLKSIGMITS